MLKCTRGRERKHNLFYLNSCHQQFHSNLKLMTLLKHFRLQFNSSMSQRSKINDTFPLIVEMRLFFFFFFHENISQPTKTTIIIIHVCRMDVKSDQLKSECEKVSLSDNNNYKKFKIININQATNMSDERMDDVGVDSGNKFGHGAQLIEIDKLIINNGQQKQRKSSRNGSGVWHQVSLLSLRFVPSSKLFFNFCYRR